MCTSAKRRRRTLAMTMYLTLKSSERPVHAGSRHAVFTGFSIPEHSAKSGERDDVTATLLVRLAPRIVKPVVSEPRLFQFLTINECATFGAIMRRRCSWRG